MKTKISLKNIYLLLVISIGLVGLGVGSTYAVFTASAEIDNPITLVTNLSYTSDIMDVREITIEANEVKEVVFNITNNSGDNLNYAIWYMGNGYDIDVGSESTTNSGCIATCSGMTNGTTYGVKIGIRNNESISVTITVGIASTSGDIVIPTGATIISSTNIPDPSGPSNAILSQVITNLYTNAPNDNKGTVANGAEGSQIQYNVVEYPNKTNPTWGLINDRLGGTTSSLDGGNIRYYGASPENYIYFNCSDYSNQSSETCEVWRIIGVFDSKVKIIRLNSIGAYAYDTSATGVNSGRGSNNWTQADIMKLLNPGYDSQSIGGSLYYNSGAGSCYTGRYDASTECSFTNTGIKENTKDLISTSTWNIGAWDATTTQYPGQMYAIEGVTTWNGKISLLYPSDYAYATNFNYCNKVLTEYGDELCKANNWMVSMFMNNNVAPPWLLTPLTNSIYANSVVHTSMHLSNSATSNSRLVFPTLYLNTDLKTSDGNGTSSNPYKLYIE